MTWKVFGVVLICAWDGPVFPLGCSWLGREDALLIYKFENYSLDPARRELRCGAELVPIEPQIFDLLQHLIGHRERVVTKDDLIAEVWQGRIVSDSTLSSSITAVRHAVGDNGEQQRLIRTFARKGLRFVGLVYEELDPEGKSISRPLSHIEGDEAVPRPHAKQILPLPDKPSIAILPFANISGDHEQEYFADGMTEDLTTALSQFRWLFVIARGSSFTFKGRGVDVKTVGLELGVRYVLEGSVRKAANRVRITGQLIDAGTGIHLWADRFDGGLEDIFDLQDRVTSSVVGAIAPKLEQAEIERAKRKPTESLDAYDYFLRGMASVRQGTRASNVEALRYFYKTIELDPDFSSAYGLAAWCYAWRQWDGFVADRLQEKAEAERLARRAAELGKDDAVGLCAAGYALVFVAHDLDEGAAFIDQALVLNPNLVTAWHSSGWTRVFLGEPELAVKQLTHAMRLSPLDPLIFRAQGGIAYAHYFAGRYDEACSWAHKAFREQPNYRPALRIEAAGHALAGRSNEARAAMRRLRHLDPELRLSNLQDLLPLRRAEDVEKFAEGLRKAGLSD